MPKRTKAYMQAQRDAIARAALQVLVEKGYYETSLRDICQAAGVSNGALYSYFPTREAVVVAACALDFSQQRDSDLPSSWCGYVKQFSAYDNSPGSYSSKRFRLSMQFVAEISQMKINPEGLSAIHLTFHDTIRRTLAGLRSQGLITLPYGCTRSTEMHMQLIAGMQYQLGSNRDVDREPVIAAFETMMALTAGLVEAVPAATLSRAS